MNDGRAILTRGAVLVTILAFTAGCTSKPASNDAAEPPIRVPAAVDMRTFTLPLDEYRNSDSVAAVVSKANGLLFAQCMRRFGFEVPATVPKAAPVKGYERRYGLTDQAKAQRLGYHHPDQPATGAARPAQPAPPSAAYESVARGEGPRTHQGQQVPEGGCAGESWRRLDEGAPAVEDARLGDRLASEAFQRTIADSRVRDSYANWSSCMKRRGFDYADPWKAVNDPAFMTDRASAAEIAVAVGDTGCKAEAKVVQVQAAVETAYQQRALEQNAEALGVVQRFLKAQQSNAARVVAAG